MQIIESVRWSDDGTAVTIIDQRLLPEEFVELDLRTLDDVCEAISTLAVRGAPAIGIAGAMGLVVAIQAARNLTSPEFRATLVEAASRIRSTRPTAVNLPWAMARMVATAKRTDDPPAELIETLRREASAILEEDRAMCRAIGDHAVALVPQNARILTHCNTGALATGGIGTALAAVYVAAERGLGPVVYADETRPLFQGSRLTAWELSRAGIPVTVLVDSAAATLMAAGRIDLVIIGADRIAANGDVANKIGSYSLAVAAKHHGIPFYVAAPSSTVDSATRRGTDILVEQRAPDEVRRVGGVAVAPRNVAVHNPAFDVTPAELITAIITDRGIARPPYHF